MTRQRTRPAALLTLLGALLGAFLAGCGTTVPSATTAALDPGDGLGAPVTTPLAPGLGGADPVTSVDGSGPGAAGPTTPGRTPTASVVAPVASRGASTPSARTAPGVTATTISVGFTYVSNGNEANAAFGFGAAALDQRTQYELLVADLNARGGVAGRKVVAVYHPYEAASSTTPASQDQAACERFTQDSRVFAVASSGLTETLPACLRKAGVLQVDAGTIAFLDREFLRQNPHYLDLGSLTFDRIFAGLVTSLERTGWFGGWDSTTGQPVGAAKPVIGILSFDAPRYERPLSRVLLPALARRGSPVSEDNVVRLRPVTSSAEIAQLTTEVQNAVLRFRGNGVTHVMHLAGALPVVTFIQGADRQGYQPRHGVDSSAGVQSLVDTGLLTSDQLDGASGMGWLPVLDLPFGGAARYATKGTARCEKLLKSKGFTLDNANAAYVAYSVCDEVFFLEQLLGTTPALTLDGVLGAAARLGRGFTAATIPATSFGPDKRDAAVTVFDQVWDSACDCLAYRGSRELA